MEKLEKGAFYTGLAGGYSSDGLGIVRINGAVVFVPGAVRGETVELRITKVMKSSAVGELAGICHPSPDRQDPVVHSFSTHQTMVSPQIIQSILSHDTQAFDFLPRRFLLMPFSDTDTLVPELYAHTGEEFIYVLTGIVSLWVENSRYTLYPGDSVQIHSNQPHNWANNTNKVAELLSINYPNPLRSDTAGHML